MFFGPEAKWHNVAIIHKYEPFYLLEPELSYPDWSLEMFPGQHQLLRIIVMQGKAWSPLQHQPLSLKKKLKKKIKNILSQSGTFGAHWHGFLLLQNKTRILLIKCLVWLVLLAQACCLSWNTMLMVIINQCQLVMMPSSILPIHGYFYYTEALTECIYISVSFEILVYTQKWQNALVVPPWGSRCWN